jgi:hypothetical protein
VVGGNGLPRSRCARAGGVAKTAREWTTTCSMAAAADKENPAAYMMRSPGRASRWVLSRMERAALSRAG